MRTLVIAAILAGASLAHATAEICGNDVDDNGNGMVDEGCAPTLTTGVCESPLSCGTTGMVSWATGASHYDLPPDVVPAVPYGPGIGLRRFYTSMYAPGSGGPTSVNHNPMGDRWQHTYMVWIDRYAAGSGTTAVVLHTSEGQDVYASLSDTEGTWDVYTPQSGFHVMSIMYNTASPNQFLVQLLTGETLYFNSVGQLTQIWDNLPTPNIVNITWTGTSNGNVATVTDASGGRRLSFNYTSNLLTSVDYQLNYSGTWTTEHTTTYSYTDGVLMSVTIGSQLAQQYGYTNNYLTSITDGNGALIAAFHYGTVNAGEVDGVDTPEGSVGFDYNSPRTACSGDTVLYFNKGSSASCASDADCGGLLCGGAISGATGTCFQAARCLTTESLNGETVVTDVSPLGPPENPNGGCYGACTEVAQYVWSSDPTLLNTIGIKDPLGSYTSATYNENGLPTEIAYGDNDSDPTNGGAPHTAYFLYDTTYPGRPAEMRHASNYPNAGTCNLTDAGGCARTIYTYGSDTQLASVTTSGFTMGSNGAWISLSNTTDYAHDTYGRLTEIDGPVTSMRTVLAYFSSTDPTANGFPQATQRYTTATSHLDTTVLAYDIWGNAIAKTAADGTVSCRTFDSSRDYLTQSRIAMAGQSSCTTQDPSDLVWSYVRDSALRLIQTTRPDGGCVFREYDTLGRLADIKRRDDCNASSAGDTRTYSYTYDNAVTEIDTYDGSGHLTRKQPYTYWQSRRLDEIVNPVDSSYKQMIYDQAGHVSSVDDEASLGQTNVDYTTDYQISEIDRYTTSTAYDSWTFAEDFNDLQLNYSDGDSLTVNSQRDDAERFVQLASPDRSTIVKVYDAVGGVTSTTENGVLWSTLTRDLLDRALTEDYSNDSCGSASHTISRSFDSLPAGITCPIASGCNHTAGRLAYVKKSLMCSALYADNSLDQETFYSYDPAGRVVEEYIRDDSGRVADQLYTWTQDGALASVTTPSTAVIAYTFGSSGNNSDSDRITGMWQGSAGAPVIDTVEWFPFGSLEQYNQEAKVAVTNGAPNGPQIQLRTVISQNLAARISNIQMQTTGGGEKDGVAITRDSKGRVTLRDYFDNTYGVQDSYFQYDEEDRLLCETTTSVGSCPTTWSTTVKNSNTYTAAGDWETTINANSLIQMSEPISLATGTHHIASVGQLLVEGISYIYDANGERSTDAGSANPKFPVTHSQRSYTYDGHHDVTDVHGQVENGGSWLSYDVTSMFDARGRRVSKTYTTNGVTSLWFFYYDPLDRLIEVQYIPNTSSSSTYSIIQVLWLGDRPVAFTESDFPGPTVSKRYTVTDESGRVIALWSWPARGSSSRLWATNPSAWGYDAPLFGSGYYQPFVFAGQYRDIETAAYDDQGNVLEPPLSLNGARTYDPFTGSYLQPDPFVDQTQSSYVYVDNDPVGVADPTGEMRNLGDTSEGPSSGGGAGDAGGDPCIGDGDTVGCESIPVKGGPIWPSATDGDLGYGDLGDGDVGGGGGTSGPTGGGAGGEGDSGGKTYSVGVEGFHPEEAESCGIAASRSAGGIEYWYAYCRYIKERAGAEAAAQCWALAEGDRTACLTVVARKNLCYYWWGPNLSGQGPFSDDECD